jgi:phage terminase large subunit GpA-like protein
MIAKNEEIIEQDIGGLGQSSERIPRVMLCTIQNRKCIAFKYTDPKQKPSWRGKRYRKLVTKPDRMDLIEQYIDLRKGRKADDPDAREAFRFYRDNQAEIERGAVVSNQASYSRKTHLDGEPMELSAVHSYFNRVADRGQKAVSTEDDNDPPEEAGPMGLGITPALVESRISGFVRRQLPANTVALTAAIDLGKYTLHWVVTAWWHGAGGIVTDYGFQQVYGTDKSMDHEASEPMIYQALLTLRDELLQKEFVDTTGTRRAIDFCLVDSGAFTNAAYQFCREVSGIFHPSKGIPAYKPKAKTTSTTIAGANIHAQHLPAAKVWLYDLDTDYWKQFVHERFLTPTFDENNMLRRGSLSVFTPEGEKRHSQYAQHIAAEELVTKFTEGKGAKTYWLPKEGENHWLDATYMAAAGSEACGVKLIAPSEIEVAPKHISDEPKQAKPVQQAYRHGQQRFRQRQGGWIPKRRG